MHEHMTRHNAYVHTNNSPHHHQSFSIYAFTNNSPSLDIYAITNNIHNSINIYVFTNNISFNQHICIHQYQLLHIVQHTTSHNPSKEENTSPYDKRHIHYLTIIHISSFNHIKLFMKGLLEQRVFLKITSWVLIITRY